MYTKDMGSSKMKPLFVINFKTYKEATGKRALKLVKICNKVSRKYKVDIWVAVQTTDIYLVSKIGIKTLSQHLDSIDYGANTGYVLAQDVKETGAYGTLLNHAEDKLKLNVLKQAIQIAKKNKLKTIVCAANLNEARAIKKFYPDIIAFEDPKLIGTGRSISKVRANDVKKFVGLLKNTKIMPLCGAGISDNNDVKAALMLGTKGVLVSSAVVKAKNQEKALIGLVRFK